MPVAAVPRYLGSDFSSASPGLRFGMYLKLWRIESQSGKHLWTTHDVNYRREENKTSALKLAAKLNEVDLQGMHALARRQEAVFLTISESEGLRLVAESVAPFTTGIGNEHPLENGFAFLNPYGLPYLPGSGVKGVVRRAAEELTHGDFRDLHGEPGTWTLPDVWHLFGFEPWPPPKDAATRASWEEWVGGFSVSKREIDDYLDEVLSRYGTNAALLRQHLDEQDDDAGRLRTLLMERTLNARGALEFWDGIPKIAGERLTVEIMTPHQSHYYQGKEHQGSSTPHDSGKPNPISFLTVPPESEFAFHVRCDLPRLNRIAPHLAQEERWKKLVEAAFEHAYEWLGFGAKTAVGYGAMRRDRDREKETLREHEARVGQQRAEQEARERAEREKRERADRLAAMDPIDREIQAVLDARRDTNLAEIIAIIQAVEADRWEGKDKIEVARRLEARMRESKQWKEESAKKRPDRDRDYQNTLLVKRWQAGE